MVGIIVQSSKPHPLIYNGGRGGGRPNNLICLILVFLDEFKEPEFKGYGPENSKQESNVVCEKESKNSKENSDESLVEEQVTRDKSSVVESSPNVDKETVFPANKMVEFTKPKNQEKLVKKSIRSYSGQVNVVRVKGVNDVKSSAYWVWRPTKSNGASLAFKRHNYIDAQCRSNGCSRHMTGNIDYLFDFKQFDRGYVAFGGGAYGGKINCKRNS
ncbi:hypothetical protein Tco_0488665 [Tanacetum coccineum]